MRVVCRWYGKKKYKMVSEQSENRTRTITQKNGSKYKRATTHIVCKDAACERRQRDASDAVKHELDTDALKALSLMTRRRIRHLPVMDGKKMVGFVSIGDLVKYRIEIIEAEAEQMREYIATA